MTTAHDESSDGIYVILLTRDAAGVTGFPGILLPDDKVAIQNVPQERLPGIEFGEVVVVPPPDSTIPVRRVRPASATWFRDARNDRPTVVVDLAQSVADVRVSISHPQLIDQLTQHEGDIGLALRSAGLVISLRPELDRRDDRAGSYELTQPPGRRGETTFHAGYSSSADFWCWIIHCY